MATDAIKLIQPKLHPAVQFAQFREAADTAATVLS